MTTSVASATFLLRVTPEIREELRAAAEAAGISMNDLAVAHLVDGLHSSRKRDLMAYVKVKHAPTLAALADQ